MTILSRIAQIAVPVVATTKRSIGSNNNVVARCTNVTRTVPTRRSMATIGTTAQQHQQQQQQPEYYWSNQLSFASPESDFAAQLVPDATVSSYNNSNIEQHRSSSRLLVLQQPQTDSFVTKLLSTVLGRTGSTVHRDDATSTSNANVVTLPKTFKEALQSYNDQAVVITTAFAPYNIVYVNKAWEKMCGYQSKDVIDRTLRCIQGPKTNTELALTTVNNVLSSFRPQDMYLINYRKDGTSFTNHITIGTMTLTNEDDYTTFNDNFLVGILQEVQPNQVPLRMI